LNLENSFPDKSTVEIVEIEKGFYKHFCDVFFEIFKVLTISKGAIPKRLFVKNIELIEELYRQKKSVILYSAHYGNGEWFALLPIFVPHKGTGFYKKLSNNYFDQLMQIIRCRFGAIGVESSHGYKTLVNLQQNKVLTLNCVISDQSPVKEASKHWVKFLNQETAFLIGADRIAKKLNYVVIFASFQKIKRGKYEVEFILIEEEPNQKESTEIIDKYAEALEDVINKSPELWLWSHRRWKLTKPK
jgi:KDO2-lipid IV(A) lauroyltransferase